MMREVEFDASRYEKNGIKNPEPIDVRRYWISPPWSALPHHSGRIGARTISMPNYWRADEPRRIKIEFDGRTELSPIARVYARQSLERRKLGRMIVRSRWQEKSMLR